MYPMTYFCEHLFTLLQQTSVIVDILSPLLVHYNVGLPCITLGSNNLVTDTAFLYERSQAWESVRCNAGFVTFPTQSFQALHVSAFIKTECNTNNFWQSLRFIKAKNTYNLIYIPGEITIKCNTTCYRKPFVHKITQHSGLNLLLFMAPLFHNYILFSQNLFVGGSQWNFIGC